MDPLERFGHQTYTVRKKIFSFPHTYFQIFDPNEQLALYSKMKAFKLKEDIRLYTDASLTTEVLTIQAQSIIDFSAAYTVRDATTGETLGALRRKGMKSLIRDEWELFNEDGSPLGTIQEDSTAKALVRRFIEVAAVFMPQKYHVESDGQTICTMQQNFNPFVMKLVVDFTPDRQNQLDPRLGLAAAVLLCAVEGKQN